MSAARKEFYNRELNSSKDNTAAVWRLIREIVPSTKMTSNGSNIENKKIGEFNHFFANAGREAFEDSPENITSEIEEKTLSTPSRTRQQPKHLPPITRRHQHSHTYHKAT